MKKAKHVIETFEELKDYYGKDRELWNIVEHMLTIEGKYRPAPFTENEKLSIATKVIIRTLS